MKKQQVIINVGVSGSGKTTWSIDHIKKNLKTLRINRDDIRKVIRGSLEGYYALEDLSKIENMITNWEATMFVDMLRKGYDIIFDNTHLRSSYIKERIALIEYWSNTLDIDIDIKFKIFNQDIVDLLKQRVSLRDKFTHTNQTDYIDKQLVQLKSIISYVEDNYKNQILE